MRKKTLLISGIILGSATLFAVVMLVHASFINKKPIETADLTESTGPLYESLPERFKNPAPNATEAIVKKIADEIIEKNPTGPSLLNGKNAIQGIDPETLIQDVLAEEFSKFDPSELQPIISVEELNLLNDSSTAALETYFRNFQIILKATPEVPALQNLTSQEFLTFSNHLKTISDKLYSLPTPTLLAPYHAEEISLIIAEKNIFERAAYADDDPLSAYLAIQMLPQINEGFLEISSAYTEIIEEYNLNI